MWWLLKLNPRESKRKRKQRELDEFCLGISVSPQIRHKLFGNVAFALNKAGDSMTFKIEINGKEVDVKGNQIKSISCDFDENEWEVFK